MRCWKDAAAAAAGRRSGGRCQPLSECAEYGCGCGSSSSRWSEGGEEGGAVAVAVAAAAVAVAVVTGVA